MCRLEETSNKESNEGCIVLPKDIGSLTARGAVLLSNCLYNQYRDYINENIYSYVEDMLDYVNKDFLGSYSASCFIIDDLVKGSSSNYSITAEKGLSAKENLLVYSKWFLTQATINELPKESLIVLKNVIHVIDSYLGLSKKSSLSSAILDELNNLVLEVESVKAK